MPLRTLNFEFLAAKAFVPLRGASLFRGKQINFELLPRSGTNDFEARNSKFSAEQRRLAYAAKNSKFSAAQRLLAFEAKNSNLNAAQRRLPFAARKSIWNFNLNYSPRKRGAAAGAKF